MPLSSVGVQGGKATRGKSQLCLGQLPEGAVLRERAGEDCGAVGMSHPAVGAPGLRTRLPELSPSV